MEKDTLVKWGTLGGPIHVNPDTKKFYFGNNGPNGSFSKEKLFGIQGDLYFGQGKRTMTMEATVSDTKTDLVQELVEKGLTREEAIATIKDLLKDGTLREIWDEDRNEKVLVLRGQ